MSELFGPSEGPEISSKHIISLLDRLEEYIGEFSMLADLEGEERSSKLQQFREKTEGVLYVLATAFSLSRKLFFSPQFLEQDTRVPFIGMEHDLSFGSYIFEGQSDEVVLALMGIKLRIWKTTILTLLRSRFSEPNGSEAEIQEVLNITSRILRY